MGAVLTTASSVTCAPAAAATHGGTVAVSSSAKLSIGGKPVLLKAGVDQKTISGCKNPTTSTVKPCAKVGSLVTGEASKLTVGHAAVLLADRLAGLSVDASGVTQGSLQATANHSKLDAK